MSDSVTHFADEDFQPLCSNAKAGDSMWAFDDNRITCGACKLLLSEDTFDV